MLLHYLGKQKTENFAFSLKRWMLLCQQTKKTHSYYHLVMAKLPSICITIDRMHQTKPKKGVQCVTVRYHALIVYQVCHDVGRCVHSGSCSLSILKWKVDGQYWWDILLSQEMLAVACYQTCCRQQYYLPFSNTAHACTSAWCAQHSSTAAAQNSHIHYSCTMAPIGQSWIIDYKS